ncbi:hypothetical protein N0V82_010802 [Gnomoniopsis sp. IMI 355080]|nr:hypothetical protein N0V82_010802 [Gnomoniopsis sp. IMI 355080]
MDFHLEEDDPDAAAMAAAMGFSGFGSQRPAKRKFNANADATISSSSPPREKKGGNVSKTGANNAPLGVRRPLQLPPPTSSAVLPARPGENSEEIDLDDEDDEDGAVGGDGLGAGVLEAKNKFIDAVQTPGGYQSEDADSMVAQPPTRTIVDNGPPGLPARPTHQQSFQRGQDHQHGRGGGRGGSHGGGSIGMGGSAPWWEGYYDARMNENPWEKLERERGLLPRGTWVARNSGHTSVTPGAPPEAVGSGADAAAELIDKAP